MSELAIEGKVIKILPMENGVSKAGKEWNKKDFVIESCDKYTKIVAFTLFGEKTEILNDINVDDVVNVSFNVESREYNEKYFHNLNAWKIDVITKSEQHIESVNDLPPAFDDDGDGMPF